MYTLVLLTGLLAGLDNLQLGSSIGLLPLKNSRLKLALAFGFFELLSPLVGVWLGSSLAESWATAAEWIGPIAALLMGAWILFTSLQHGNIERKFAKSRAVYLLPAIFCIDNIFSGLWLASKNLPLIPSAIIVGALSAAMAVGGLYVGVGLRGIGSRCFPNQLQRGSQLMSGTLLCFLAVRMMMAD